MSVCERPIKKCPGEMPCTATNKGDVFVVRMNFARFRKCAPPRNRRQRSPHGAKKTLIQRSFSLSDTRLVRARGLPLGVLVFCLPGRHAPSGDGEERATSKPLQLLSEGTLLHGRSSAPPVHGPPPLYACACLTSDCYLVSMNTEFYLKIAFGATRAREQRSREIVSASEASSWPLFFSHWLPGARRSRVQKRVVDIETHARTPHRNAVPELYVS